MKTLLIAGANGFIARHLSEYFSSKEWEVVGLARRDEGLHPSCRYVNWDGKSIGAWTEETERCDALINLVGKSVNCRFTPKNRDLIMNSRIDSTKVLGEALAACSNPPRVWINASGANIYCDSRDHPHDEQGDRGAGFMTDVVEAWERALFEAAIPHVVRRVSMRSSMVLDDEPGNAMRTFLTLSKLGLGGKIGDGKQMVSWIHVDDVCRAIHWIIEHDEMTGPVNMTSPEPLTNAEFMCRFRKSVGMPIGLPAAVWMARVGARFLGMEPELILNSLWVVPRKLLDHGYDFKYPELKPEQWWAQGTGGGGQVSGS